MLSRKENSNSKDLNYMAKTNLETRRDSIWAALLLAYAKCATTISN
jgi:hypothetical protein